MTSDGKSALPPAPQTVALTLVQVQAALDASPAIRALGLRVERIGLDPPGVDLVMPVSDAARRQPGEDQFHGGPLMTVIDCAGDFAVAVLAGGGVPTVNLRVDFLRPAMGSHVRAVATARRIGRTLSVVDVDLLDAESRLCAVGRGSYLSAPG